MKRLTTFLGLALAALLAFSPAFAGPVTINQPEDVNSAVMGKVYRAEFSATIATATTGTYYVGLTTPNAPIRVMGRAYSSSESPLTIELFEATFSAGSNTRTLNRDLSIATSPPAQFVSGVTPGALGTAITGLTLRAPTAGGTAQVSINSDDSILTLKRNTSYVVRFTNGGGANAIVSGAIDYRQVP